MNASDVTIAIPTYNRGAILVDMLRRTLQLSPPPREIIVLDQTVEHPREVSDQLDAWHDTGAIRRLRLDVPSIPKAMNRGLVEAKTAVVLFLDDDVVPVPEIVEAHARVYDDARVWAVVGQCLEPGQQPEHVAQQQRELFRDLQMRFNHDAARDIENVIAMNLSMRRDRARSIGGFDENYVMVAYRFETDFARRVVVAGGVIRFEPRARVRHLRIATGGTRTYGRHQTSPLPGHSVGDYYFALRHAPAFLPYALHRLRTNVVTRFHATHPWTIPGKLFGELRGMLLARRLAKQGPKLLDPDE